MKDITIRSATSNNKLKKQLSFAEEFTLQGMHTKIEKQWSYTVRDRGRLPDIKDIRIWINRHKDIAQESNLKFLSITKAHNSKLHEDSFNCIAMGDLFIVSRGCVFWVDFFYALKIHVQGKGKK